jgi:hypothetical protein
MAIRYPALITDGGGLAVTACIVQRMACVRSGQAPAWPSILIGVPASSVIFAVAFAAARGPGCHADVEGDRTFYS